MCSFTVQVIPINEAGKLQEAYNIRLDENCVVDLKFLHSPLGGRPLLAVLYEDTRRARHIKTYEVALREKVSYRYCGRLPTFVASLRMWSVRLRRLTSVGLLFLTEDERPCRQGWLRHGCRSCMKAHGRSAISMGAQTSSSPSRHRWVAPWSWVRMWSPTSTRAGRQRSPPSSRPLCRWVR